MKMNVNAVPHVDNPLNRSALDSMFECWPWFLCRQHVVLSTNRRHYCRQHYCHPFDALLHHWCATLCRCRFSLWFLLYPTHLPIYRCRMWMLVVSIGRLHRLSVCMSYDRRFWLATGTESRRDTQTHDAKTIDPFRISPDFAMATTVFPPRITCKSTNDSMTMAFTNQSKGSVESEGRIMLQFKMISNLYNHNFVQFRICIAQKKCIYFQSQTHTHGRAHIHTQTHR